MDFTGLIKYVSPVQTGTSKGGTQWRKLEAVLEEVGQQYPQSIVITQMGDVIDQQRLVVGRVAKVYLGARANEHNGRWFNSITCWKVENIGGAPVQPTYQQPTYQQPSVPVQSVPENKEDLPF